MDERRGRKGSRGALALLFETATKCSGGDEDRRACDQHTLGWVHHNLGLEIQRQVDEGASDGMEVGCWRGIPGADVALAAERELSLAREQNLEICPR